jgi:hypothetical protein
LPPADEASLSRARYEAAWQDGPRIPGGHEGPNELLHPEDRSLGYWARPAWVDGKVVAVRFAVVSHGRGHLSGFIRVYEGEIPSNYDSPIAPGWYRIRF